MASFTGSPTISANDTDGFSSSATQRLNVGSFVYQASTLNRSQS